MDGIPCRASADTVHAIEQAVGCGLIYSVWSGDGSGLAAAKWRLDGFRITTGHLRHGILSCRMAGTAGVTRRSGGKAMHRRPEIGSVTFAPAGTRAEWAGTGPCEALHVYIGPDTVCRFAARELTTASVPRIDDFFAIADPWLAGYFQMLVSEFEIFANADQTADLLFLGQTEHLLLRHLLQWHSDATDSDAQALQPRHTVNPLRASLMRKVQEYIDANLGRDIRVQDLADLAYMSVDHFLRAFRAASGTTPYHYVLDQRLRRACRALKETAAPISCVAIECGFKTTSHLSAKFHARIGLSPSAYRCATQQKWPACVSKNRHPFSEIDNRSAGRSSG